MRVAVLLCFLLIAAPAGAATRWHAPVVVAPAAVNPQVWMDAQGRALVAWQVIRLDGVAQMRYAWRAPRGRWSRPRTLFAGPGRLGGALTLAANGTATAAWTTPDGRMAVARARPGAAFGAARLVGAVDSARLPPAVATDDEARAIVTWSEAHTTDGGRVMALLVGRGGEVGEPREIGAGQAPTVAMNAAGAAVVAWTDVHGRPFASVRPPAGGFGPAQAPDVQTPVGSPRAVIDADGRAIVGGTEFLPPGSARPATTFATAGADGTFGPRLTIDVDGHIEQLFAEPDGTVDFLSRAADGARLLLRSRSPGGAIEGPLELSGPDGCMGALAAARGGDLLATWTTGCGAGAFQVLSRPSVRIRRGGRFSPRRRLGLPGAVGAKGAITDGDEAVVVYTHWPTAALHAVVREDRGDGVLPAPPVLELELPPTLSLGDGGALDLTLRCRRSCRVRPGGLLHAGAKAVRGLRRGARRLRPGRTGTVAVDFGAAAVEAVQQAVAAGESAWLTVSVVVEGDSPRPHTITRRVELRP